MNPILKNKSGFSYLRKTLAREMRYIKDLIYNFRNTDLVFSEILSFCMFSFVSKDMLNNFIQHNVLFDLTLLKIINDDKKRYKYIFDYFFDNIEKYKFISKFIFLENQEFINFFKCGKDDCDDKLYILHLKIKKIVDFHHYLICEMNFDIVYDKLKLYDKLINFESNKNFTLLDYNESKIYIEEFKKFYQNETQSFIKIKRDIFEKKNYMVVKRKSTLLYVF